MASIYNKHNINRHFHNNEIDVIESCLNRRHRTDYTEVEKLLDTILHESPRSKHLSFQSEGVNITETNGLDNTEKQSIHDSEFSDDVIYQSKMPFTQFSQEQSHSSYVKESEKHVENFYLVKMVRSYFNFRKSSVSELVVNALFSVLHGLYWILTHSITREILCQIGMKIFELFVTIIMAGIMILMSIVTCGRDLEICGKPVSHGKEIVKVNSREILNPKPSTSRLMTGMRY